MRVIVLLTLTVLAGCDAGMPSKPPEWRCINGLTYEHIDSAWVLLDGHAYVGRKDGPIKCAEPVEGKSGDGK